jgi:hypothetical protein
MWIEFVGLREVKNFPKLRFSNSQFDKWLHKATLDGIKYFISRRPFFHLKKNMFLLISLLFLELKVEVLKFFDTTISDFSLIVKKVLDIFFLSSYVKQWRLVVWETCFFQAFKPEDGI